VEALFHITNKGRETSIGRKGVELSTLRKGLEILGLFSEETTLLDTSSVAKRMGLSKSTVYKYVQTLEGSRFLVREKSGRFFELGPRLLELASVAQKPSKLVDVSYPILQELVDRTNETAHLVTIMGNHAVCLAGFESNHNLKLSYRPGAMYPLYAGASAQVLLAGLDDATQKGMLASVPLNRFTEKTITSRKELFNKLQQIRRDGFAVSRGELDEGTFSVAAQILSGAGDVLGGISVGGPLHRLDASKETKYIKLVRGAARKIARLLEESCC